MNAYSNDLRERVMAVIDKGAMTQEEIMEHFGVCATFIYLLKKRVQETGSVSPKPHGGGMPAKFAGKGLEKIRIYVEKNPDATLYEILEYTGKKASIMAVSRALDRLGFHRKKSRYGHRSRIEKI
jgi:transposase